MQLYELKKATKQKTIPNILILTGEEQQIMKIYTDKISEVYSLETKRLENLKEMITDLGIMTFSGKQKLFIIRNCKEFQKTEKLWEQLPKMLKGNKLILIYDSVDKREKFYKKFFKKPDEENSIDPTFGEVEMVEFEKLTGEQLSKYILKDTDLGLTYALKLADLCGYDYGRVLLELDKIKQLYNSFDGKKTYQEVFEKALLENLIYKKPEEKVFDFVEYVLTNNYERSFSLWNDLQELKTSEILLLSLLYSNFKTALLVQGCKGGATAEKTGLTGWQIHNVKDKLNFYTVPELIETLKTIRKIERGIKTGLVDAKISIDYLLCSVLRL